MVWIGLGWLEDLQHVPNRIRLLIRTQSVNGADIEDVGTFNLHGAASEDAHPVIPILSRRLRIRMFLFARIR